MKSLLNKSWFVVLVLFLYMPVSYGIGLSGSVSVNQNSDTAADAKNKALNSARRQILTDVLSQYSNKDALSDLLQNAPDDSLMNLIVSSSVSNEQMSTNSYSARITMNIDNDAVKKWLDENNVQNWVPLVEDDERFTVVITVPNGITDWAEIRRIVRDDKIEIETQGIRGNQIVARMPQSYRTKFTAAVRKAGWKYGDNEGALQIWK